MEKLFYTKDETALVSFKAVVDLLLFAFTLAFSGVEFLSGGPSPHEGFCSTFPKPGTPDTQTA